MQKRDRNIESDVFSSKADAVFIGWQSTSWGKVFPLYNVTVAGHPRYGSTITDDELRRLHLRIPYTPPPPELGSTVQY